MYPSPPKIVNSNMYVGYKTIGQGLYKKACVTFYFNSYFITPCTRARVILKRLTAILDVMIKNSYSEDHLLESKFQL